MAIYIQHGRGPSKKHKYLYKVGKKYIYPEDVKAKNKKDTHVIGRFSTDGNGNPIGMEDAINMGSTILSERAAASIRKRKYDRSLRGRIENNARKYGLIRSKKKRKPTNYIRDGVSTSAKSLVDATNRARSKRAIRYGKLDALNDSRARMNKKYNSGHPLVRKAQATANIYQKQGIIRNTKRKKLTGPQINAKQKMLKNSHIDRKIMNNNKVAAKLVAYDPRRSESENRMLNNLAPAVSAGSAKIAKQRVNMQATPKQIAAQKRYEKKMKRAAVNAARGTRKAARKVGKYAKKPVAYINYNKQNRIK